MTEAEWESEVYRLADAYCAAITDEDRARIAEEFFDRTVLIFNEALEPAAAIRLAPASHS
jgi:hypothetical protein